MKEIRLEETKKKVEERLKELEEEIRKVNDISALKAFRDFGMPMGACLITFFVLLLLFYSELHLGIVRFVLFFVPCLVGVGVLVYLRVKERQKLSSLTNEYRKLFDVKTRIEMMEEELKR